MGIELCIATFLCARDLTAVSP